MELVKSFDAFLRTILSYRGQRHLPGLYWSSSTHGHAAYESRLELARLLLADRDRNKR